MFILHVLAKFWFSSAGNYFLICWQGSEHLFSLSLKYGIYPLDTMRKQLLLSSGKKKILTQGANDLRSAIRIMLMYVVNDCIHAHTLSLSNDQKVNYLRIIVFNLMLVHTCTNSAFTFHEYVQ